LKNIIKQIYFWSLPLNNQSCNRMILNQKHNSQQHTPPSIGPNSLKLFKSSCTSCCS